MSIFTSITGIVFGKKNPHRGLNVLFHEQALPHGQHGILIANNRSRGFKNERIRFVFDQTKKAPALTCELMAHVWQEAIKQGYEPVSLQCYGTNSYFQDESDKARAAARNIPAVQHTPEQSVVPPAATGVSKTVHGQAADKFDEMQKRYTPSVPAVDRQLPRQPMQSMPVNTDLIVA